MAVATYSSATLREATRNNSVPMGAASAPRKNSSITGGKSTILKSRVPS